MVVRATKGRVRGLDELSARIKAASGQAPADLVIRGGTWLDVFSGVWRTGDIAILGEWIVGVAEDYEAHRVIDATGLFIVPGFIDSHAHIESSMMTPQRFAEAVLPRGTTTVLWDPHEIANVKGMDGIRWAIAASEQLPLDLFVLVPSCVPSTTPSLALETSGAVLDAASIQDLGRDGNGRVLGLAEMMNWPGLLSGDPEVLQKLLYFQDTPRDGHCPGLSGKELNAYAAAGIHSCHESTTLEEAQEKLSKGIHVLIREGSCAKDADALLPILNARSSPNVAFCSDDRNPLDIEESGHIDCIVNKALKLGQSPIDVFRSASWSASLMYGLRDRGAIAPGYLADLVLLKPRDGTWIQGIEILETLRRGVQVSALGVQDQAPSKALPWTGKNLNLGRDRLSESTLKIASPGTNKETRCRVIGLRPNQIVTDTLNCELATNQGAVMADPDRDILKIAVFERHKGTGQVGVALVQGFQIKSGAIATSINHDCHNVIVVGSSDNAMLKAVDELCRLDGGIIVVSEDGDVRGLPLPIGGLMTDEPPESVSQRLRELKSLARAIGCELEEPFLQLSFLALPVIPSLKVTDRGLVDGESFEVCSVVL